MQVKRFALWTAERRRKAVELYTSGLTAVQVGKILNTNNTRVKYALAAEGVSLRPRKKLPPSVWTSERDAEVAKLYARGLSQADIARLFKTNKRLVRASLLRSGVSIHRADQSGSKNSAWRGGRFIDDDGYVQIYAPSHPSAKKSGYVAEHRLVMEKMIGRPLTPDEVVHHKKPPRSNNAPSNLQLYSSNAEHLKEELTGRCPDWTPDGKRRISERGKRNV